MPPMTLKMSNSQFVNINNTNANTLNNINNNNNLDTTTIQTSNNTLANNTRNHASSRQCGHPFKMAYWNAAGVSNKCREMEAFMCHHNVDIMMVIELRQRASQSASNSVRGPFANNVSPSIDGYHTYVATRKAPNQRFGGVAILIRHGIKHIALEPIMQDACQCAPVAITLSTQETILVAPIYCPPQYKWTSENFGKLLSHIDSLSPQGFIICGDWNAKSTWWGNMRHCQRGRELLRTIHSNKKYNILATGGTTHYPYARGNQPSAIDFAIYGGIGDRRLRTYSINDLNSDHLPILIDLAIGQALNRNNVKNKILPRNANIKKFKRILNQNLRLNIEINSGTDIEDAIDILYRKIENAASAATPPLRRRWQQLSRTRYGRNKLSASTLRQIRIKRQLKSSYMLLRTPLARSQYRQAQNRLNRLLRRDKNDNLNRQIAKINETDTNRIQQLWRTTNFIKRQPEPNRPLKINSGTTTSNGNGIQNHNRTIEWTKTNEQKAEVFAAYLEQRFSLNLTNTAEERSQTSNEVTQFMQLQQQQQHGQINTPPFRPVTDKEVCQLIAALTLKKAPGIDNIDNHVIKSLPHKAILYLTHIYNCILRHGHFPRQWKCAEIKMILKTGKPTEKASSYRPISLLAGFSKIFERILMTRMFECKNFAQSIPNHQFGFRKEHGTEQQLARVTQFILNAYEKKQYCSAVFIDICEAFDRVWHEGLLSKLAKLLPAVLWNVIKSYLTDRTFIVNGNEGTKSRIGHISAGVPQGSVLGPILYTVYTSDMPLPSTALRNFWATNEPTTTTSASADTTLTPSMLLSTFADDTVVMCAAPFPDSAVNRNDRYLQAFEKWTKRWCIQVNVSKTAHVMFTLRTTLRQSQTAISPRLNGQEIANKSRHQYLGVQLDKKLNMKQHVTTLCARTGALCKKLDWLIGAKSPLNIACKMTIYKQMIAPIWRYALPIWGALLSSTQFNRLEVGQNKILRRIAKATRYTRNQTIRESHGIDTVDEIYQQTSERFAIALSNHPNINARKLISEPYTPIRLNRPLYSLQLERHVRPLQQLQQQHLTTDDQEMEDRLPTLLRLEHEEREARRQANAPSPNTDTYGQRPRPTIRFGEGQINTLRRRYRSGLMSRENLIDYIREQPAIIQKLILSDLQIAQTPPPTGQQQQQQELLNNNNDEQQLSLRLEQIRIQIEREIDEMQQQSHNEQQRIQTAHQSAQRTIYDLTADDSNNDDDDDSVIWINSSPSGVDNNTHSLISQIPTSGNQLIRLNEQPTGLMAPIHEDDDNEPPQQQQPTQTAQTVLSQQNLQQSIQLLDTRQLPATPQPQQQQLQDTSPVNRLKRKRMPSQTAQRPNNTCKSNEYQQKRPAIKHTVSESELTPKKPCRYLASTWELQLSQQRLQLGKRHHVDPAYADPPSPKRSRMQQQRHANKPACILIHYTSGKWVVQWPKILGVWLLLSSIGLRAQHQSITWKALVTSVASERIRLQAQPAKRRSGLHGIQTTHSRVIARRPAHRKAVRYKLDIEIKLN